MATSRVSILYPSRPGARFDFSYYVPNHLPLAVGTSLRHAAITGCDASQPIHDDCAFACICTVTFEHAEAMANFRNFFATGHPETARILADEPNYTDITPLFVAGTVQGDPDPGVPPGGHGYRMQLVIPAVAGTRCDAGRLAKEAFPMVGRLLLDHVHPTALSMDHMEAGVPSGSRPDVHAIITAWCADEEGLLALRRQWAGNLAGGVARAVSTCTDAPVQAAFSRVSTLDMALARAVARGH